MNAILLVLVGLCTACQADAGGPPLPSWSDGPVREALIDFVERVVDPTGKDFVPPAERIAVFDNDGTLWAEKPLYFQLQYAIDYVRDNAAANPAWREQPPFKAILDNDLEGLAAGGERGLMEIGLMEILMASHAGMTTTEFSVSVADWLESTVHPQRQRRYPELIYQPMLELLELLRANGFQTWIVSGGGIAFIRVFAEEVYGIPPEQVVGSSIELEFEMRDGEALIVRRPAIDFINDKAGKPVAIQRHIGRRPVAAFGNSDGDLQMLQWTAAGDGPRLMFLLHHTDARREWAYDRDSHVGRLDAALTEARSRGWVVADMRRDWRLAFAHELPSD